MRSASSISTPGPASVIEPVKSHSSTSPSTAPAAAQNFVSSVDTFSWRDITYDVLLSKAKRKEIKKAGSNALSESSAPEKTATNEKAHDAEEGNASPTGSIDEVLPEHQEVFPHLPPLDPMRRRVLNGITGHVKKGEMVAILGASGAGKTSFLSVLSARLDKSSDIAGEVLFKANSAILPHGNV